MSILPDPPEFVTPGQPVEAIWGNEVVAWVRQAVTTVNTLMPIGVVAPYTGGFEPPGWLFCQGQAVSTTTYSALYAVVGDRYNQGQPAPGGGQFRLPNMQARFPVGSNVGSSLGMGAMWVGGPGEVAGDYEPTMPPHNHSVPNHLHGIDIATGSENHAHWHVDNGDGRFVFDGPGESQIPLHYLPVGVGTDIGGPRWFHFSSHTGEEDSEHQHGVQGATGGADRDLTTGIVGGSAAHAQIPPGVAFNFIIRAS